MELDYRIMLMDQNMMIGTFQVYNSKVLYTVNLTADIGIKVVKYQYLANSYLHFFVNFTLIKLAFKKFAQNINSITSVSVSSEDA